MSRRAAGLIGLTGAMVLFTGDMFLYGHWGAAADFWAGARQVAREASLTRIFVGGLLGPVGAVLYLAGFWHVYLNTRAAGRLAAKVTMVGLISMFVSGGAYHAVWVVRMLSLKHGISDDGSLSLFTEAFESYMSLIYNTAALPGCVAGAVLTGLVLTGRSLYPRWTVLVNPGLLMLIQLVVGDSLLPAPAGAVILGGYTNLAFCVFFTVSVITTWRKEPSA